MDYKNTKIKTKDGDKRLEERGTHNQRARSKEGSNAYAHDNKLNTNNLSANGENVTENGELIPKDTVLR